MTPAALLALLTVENAIRLTAALVMLGIAILGIGCQIDMWINGRPRRDDDGPGWVVDGNTIRREDWRPK